MEHALVQFESLIRLTLSTVAAEPKNETTNRLLLQWILYSLQSGKRINTHLEDEFWQLCDAYGVAVNPALYIVDAPPFEQPDTGGVFPERLQIEMYSPVLSLYEYWAMATRAYLKLWGLSK